jgi:hypothetical protein
VSEDLMFETILPLLGMKNASFIAISTPRDSQNFFSRMLELTDKDGSTLFNVKHIGLTCPACLQLPTYQEMMACTHGAYKLPPWKSHEKGERLKIISEKLDDPARNLRENSGIVADDSNTVFLANIVKRLFLPGIMHTTMAAPKRIYLMADPNAGGSTSNLSLVSGYRIENDRTLPDGMLNVSTEIYPYIVLDEMFVPKDRCDAQQYDNAR